MAGAQRNLFSACPQYAAARDHRVHLFLIVPNVIVLGPLCARGQLLLYPLSYGGSAEWCQSATPISAARR